MRHTLTVLALSLFVVLACRPQPKPQSTTDPQNPRILNSSGSAHREYDGGRCKNASIRVVEDPDDDYYICYGHSPLYAKNAHLKEFRARFGPDPATIRRNCPSILAQVQAATAGKKLDELERLSPGYTFFCTDTPFS
jgi:hypothetical protein